MQDGNPPDLWLNADNPQPWYPNFTSSRRLNFVHERSPPPSCSSQGSIDAQLTAPENEDPFSAKTNGKRCWEVIEVKSVIQAFKSNEDHLKAAKSNKVKKSVWEAIHAEYVRICDEEGMKSNKTSFQAKEKWRALFEKHKSLSDNNKRTGKGRDTSFKFFDEIDEFMGCLDKLIQGS